MPGYHLITYGCQMNKNDSERAASLLESLGFNAVAAPEAADLILLNTCSVRQTAEDRVFGLMRLFAKLKEKNPRLLIGLMGCMAGRDAAGELRRKLPLVDFFFPTREMIHLPRWIAERNPELLESAAVPEDYLKIAPRRASPFQAFVTIQTGCNKFCSYCVVPYARGREWNRPFAEIIREIRELAAAGTVEVTLLGQAVNAWQAPDPENFSADNPFKDNFAALLWEVDAVPGIERFHYTAPHPIHLSEEGIRALALPKHVRFLHLPVQAGSSEVLRKMNRRYGREQFLDLIARVKKQVPAIALGTDIIVGFSGESAAQFEETVSLYQEVGFDISYTAQYSPRSGTVAARAFPDDVSREEKKRRWEVLQKLMEEIVLAKNQVLVGRTLRVLVETVDKQGIAEGNCEYMKRVRFQPVASSQSPVGRFFDVKITSAREWVLEGEAV